MRKLTILEALREALNQEMETNPAIFLIGEDIRIGGGFGVSKGLVQKFGGNRILDTPISEIGFTGLAIGAAMEGMRPIVEYQFGDFVFCAMDQIVNQAAKLRYMSAGQVQVPIVFRLPVGANRRGVQHAQCTESIFMNVPGLQIVSPATPYDAKGMLISAIRNENPVLFYEHKLLYNQGGTKGILPEGIDSDVPEEPYTVPFGHAVVRRCGNDVTVVANMLMLHRSLVAAVELQREGLSVEIIDPRSLVPMDIKTIAESVKKTRRLVVVEECQPVGSWANEVIASVGEEIDISFVVKRIGTAPTPIPYSSVLENEVIPSIEHIKKAIKETVEKRRRITE